MHLLPKNKSGFTLVEVMLAMTVFAIIMTSVLLAVENMSIARIKTENRVKLLEELYYFSEQLVNNVKE
jgi:prepilin-type N-terminal cleavage/methylation domain-containing protein